VTGLDSLELFLRGRLRTAGLVAAAVAAAACEHVRSLTTDQGEEREQAAPVRDDYWDRLDAETDARIPSPAQREASRRQGRALLRTARVAWPGAGWLAVLAPAAQTVPAARPRDHPGGPHHAVVLGAAAAAAGCDPGQAARIAAYQAVAGPVSAAVRLLALDPLRATAVLAGLADDIARTAAGGAAWAGGRPADLPGPSGPALDLLAEAHMGAEVRLFES
jgi:urease accessory protein